MKTEYITKKEFNNIIENHELTLYFCFGLIFVVPVLYSITANTKIYLGFYGMCIIGIFFIVYSVVKYFKWRKKYG